jgi:hypothetical protein
MARFVLVSADALFSDDLQRSSFEVLEGRLESSAPVLPLLGKSFKISSALLVSVVEEFILPKDHSLRHHGLHRAYDT